MISEKEEENDGKLFFMILSGLLKLKIINNNLVEKVSLTAVSIFSLSKRFGSLFDLLPRQSLGKDLTVVQNCV